VSFGLLLLKLVFARNSGKLNFHNILKLSNGICGFIKYKGVAKDVPIAKNW
jgi:hypothetical protein